MVRYARTTTNLYTVYLSRRFGAHFNLMVMRYTYIVIMTQPFVMLFSCTLRNHVPMSQRDLTLSRMGLSTFDCLRGVLADGYETRWGRPGRPFSASPRECHCLNRQFITALGVYKKSNKHDRVKWNVLKDPLSRTYFAFHKVIKHTSTKKLNFN